MSAVHGASCWPLASTPQGTPTKPPRLCDTTVLDESYEMVQTYGVASDRAAHDTEPHGGDEHEALLGRDASARKPKQEGHATIHSSVGNLANTIIGSGEFSCTWK